MIPQKFQVTGNAIASYDWLDLTSGTGYRSYYPTEKQSDGYVLITKVRDAPTTESYISVEIATHVDAQLTFDLDFDIIMNVPCIIRGTAYLNFSQKLVEDVVGNVAHRYFVCNVYHFDGVNETLVGTCSSKDYGGIITIRRELLSIALASKKFAIGHTLRLNVQGWASQTAGTHTLYLYYDPSSLLTLTDSSSRTIGTDFIFDCPFKIDIT